MDTDHLRYYLEKVQLPVFLVLVDLAKPAGYFCFLQEWLFRNEALAKLNTQTTLTVRIPIADRLEDQKRFREALVRSTQFMLTHKVWLEKRRLEALDPRFTVGIVVSSQRVTKQFTAKEPTQITLVFAPGVPPEIPKRFEQGYPVLVGPTTCQVFGTPLLKVDRDMEISASYSRSSPINLIACDENGKELASLLQIPCTISGGISEERLQSHLAGSPLQVSVRTRRVGGGLQTRSEVRLSVDLASWKGKLVNRLPFLDELSLLLSNLAKGASIKMEGYGDAPAVFKMEPKEQFEPNARLLGMLVKAKAIASHLARKIPLPEAVTEGDIRNVSFAHDLIFSGRATESCGRGTITVKRLGARKSDVPEKKGGTSPLVLRGTVTLEGLGGKIELKDAVQTISSCSLKKTLYFEDSQTLILEFETTENSVMVTEWRGASK
jgi:hypothetical protein